MILEPQKHRETQRIERRLTPLAKYSYKDIMGTRVGLRGIGERPKNGQILSVPKPILFTNGV